MLAYPGLLAIGGGERSAARESVLPLKPNWFGEGSALKGSSGDTPDCLDGGNWIAHGLGLGVPAVDEAIGETAASAGEKREAAARSAKEAEDGVRLWKPPVPRAGDCELGVLEGEMGLRDTGEFCQVLGGVVICMGGVRCTGACDPCDDRIPRSSWSIFFPLLLDSPKAARLGRYLSKA